MISFDVVVLGGGPGGDRAAIQAARAGKRVALVALRARGAQFGPDSVPASVL